jgi:WD40 repeat protein/serine/threonine protein kinase/tetratricopeptide (TPR) repeat protein
MPGWDPEANDLFLRAREIAAPEDRQRFLDEACAGNCDLRARVEGLLRAGAEAGSFLERPAEELGATGPFAPGPQDERFPASPEGPGSVIGPYKLLEPIGEGGMGTVWMADQTEPIQRRVAVKVVKEGMDSKQVLARFEAERQALALMDHPNIAKVLDAGKTPSGRPYFVMELVKGKPITAYCDEKRLGVRERLALFGDVCRAVQHAHQKGIIHRDLKPSNVLVAPYDGKPVVKVIDFGVAKATGQRLTDKTLFTGFGALVGTPEYMSPEQAEVNNQDIDTRSDIYALGVLLYELLTGSTPLTRKRLKEAALLEVLRVIREEEPPRPSTRLSESKDSLPSISAQRHTEPAKLTKLVRGELDWIVMKALEKDRTRRYETANGFAMDVQRYLADEPVQACPPSVGYRLRKFSRRNRGLLTAATLVLFALVLGTIISLWQAIRATEATNAEREVRRGLDRALKAETNALGKATASATLAQQHSQAMQITLSDMYTTQGLIAADRREPAQAALWFANAARITGADEARTQANRIRAEVWGRLAPQPVAAVSHPAEWLASMAFHPGGRYLLTHGHDLARGEGECQVWDLKRQAAWPVPGAPKAISAADWDWTGERLAFGSPAGAVAVIRFPGGEPLQRFALVGRVHRLLFSPDGRYLAVAAGRVARVWDCKQGSFVTPLLPHPALLTTLAFHPDGRLLATGCQDHRCRVFPVPAEGDRPLFDPVPHLQDVLTTMGEKPVPPAFVDQGRGLLTFTGAAVFRRDPTTGKVQGTVGDNSPTRLFTVSPDGAFLFRGGFGPGRIWSVPRGAAYGAPITPRLRSVLSATFSPDCWLLATGSGDRCARLWSLAEGKLVGSPLSHPTSVVGVAFSPDGRHLATAQRYGLIRVWRLPPGSSSDVRVPIRVPSFARLSADGRYVIPSGYSRGAGSVMPTRVYEAATGRPAGPWLAPGGRLVDASLAPDGRHAITAVSLAAQGMWRGRLAFWDWHEGKPAAEALDLPSYPRKLDYSPDGRLVAVLCVGGELLLVDARTGKLARRWHAHDPAPSNDSYVNNGAVRFSPDGNRVVTYGTKSNSARFWVPASGALRFELPHRGKCHDVRYSADGRLVATASYDGTACVWDAATGRRLRELRHPDCVFTVEFNADGTRLLTACRDGMARLWAWETGRLVCPAFEHEHEARTAAFTPDGRFVVTTSDDGTLRVWETVTGKLLAPAVPLDGSGLTLAITPDGGRAVVGGIGEDMVGQIGSSVALIDLRERLSPGKRPAEELWRAGELLSGQRVHEGGGVANLSPDEWLQRWHSFRERAPRQAEASWTEPSRLAWQQQRAESHCNRGTLLLSRGFVDEAIAAFRESIRVKQDLADPHYHLGRALATKGWPDEALANYSRAIELGTKLVGAWTDRGIAYFMQGQYDKAVTDFSQVIERDPKQNLALFYRGIAYCDHLGQPAKAVADFSRAIELNRWDAYSWHNRGVAYRNLRLYDKAVTDFSEAINLDPKFVSAWMWRGAIYCDHLGQPDKAVADFSKAIELEPKKANPWFNRGNAYRNLGQCDKAIADYSRAIQLDPKNVGALLERASAFGHLGQYDKALADGQTAVKVAPDHAGAHNNLAWLLATCPDEKLRDPKRAVELGKKAVQLAPKGGPYWGTLGAAHYRAGDWKATLAALAKCRELKPGWDAYAWFFLAMAHRKLGHEGEAGTAYAQAVQWLESNRELLAKYRYQAEELQGLRSEAAEVLKLKKK